MHAWGKTTETLAIATGVQRCHDRFGDKPRYSEYSTTPSISPWRCNLTALSQSRNHYFVAYGEEIYVYIPRFPAQSIPEQPALIFTSQPSSPDLQGHLDLRQPHCINSLIVQFLGTEEVVAVVRDDGDVDAFLVRHIAHAIERRAEPDSAIGVAGDEIRPFFQSNVQKSAWGLAIHTEARILATSSNAHEVRVFKFGLTQEDESDAYVGLDEDMCSSEEISYDHKRQRKRDVTHQVINGESNIPHIAFCNTGDDPEARWLLTTDISGICRVMDLHALQAVQAFRFGRGFASPHLEGFDRINAGWTVMFLDRRSFRSDSDACTALGLDGDDIPAGLHRNDSLWDLSCTIDRLPEACEPFVHHRTSTTDAVRENVGSSLEEHESMTMDSPPDHDSLDMSDDSDGGAPINIEIEMSEGYDEEDADIEVDVSGTTERDDIEPALSREAESPARPNNQEEIDPPPNTSDSSNTAPLLNDDGQDSDYEGTEDSIPFTALYSGGLSCPNGPTYTATSTSPSTLCDGLPCPILHASVRNIYLLQPALPESPQSHIDSDEEPTNPFVPPLLGFAHPLSQLMQQNFSYLRHFERLNMSAYIPSLGLVVLASQKGRAVVLALSKLPASAKYPREMEDGGGSARSPYGGKTRERQRGEKDRWREKRTIYCMRVAAILPFAEQEGRNERPVVPLHGIAVGPVQGREGDGNGYGCGRQGGRGGRWRLMMHYQDHSILSYELRRPWRRGGGSEVEEVVV